MPRMMVLWAASILCLLIVTADAHSQMRARTGIHGSYLPKVSVAEFSQGPHGFIKSRALKPFSELPFFLATDTDDLPENIPFLKRQLWGERGLVRVLGLAPATRSRELELRRSMLQWYQATGLLTFGLMTTQVVTGLLMRSDPVRYQASLESWHRPLGYATYGTYIVTALLSVFAPPARRYTGAFSNIRLHGYLAVIHFAGMMVQPWIGRAARKATTADDYNRYIDAHRWVGIATYSAFTIGMITIALPY